MAAKEYDAFYDNPKGITDGQELNIAIRELTPEDRRYKYRTRYVKAVLSKNPDKKKDDILWLRFNRGSLYAKPFGIKIIEELGPFEVKERLMVSA